MGAPTDPAPRRAPEVLWWLGAALVHVALVQLLAERMPFAWLYIPASMAAWIGARRGMLPPHLPLCLAGATCYLLAEPATGFGWAVLFPFVAFLPVIRETPGLRAVFLKGLWSGFVIASGIYGWIWPTTVRFFDGGMVRLSPIYFGLSLLVAVQIAVFFLLARLLHARTAIPMALAVPVVYTVCEFWLSLPMAIPLPLAFAFQPVWIQTLDLAGISGTTFLIVCCGVAVAHLVESLRAADRRGALVGGGALAALLALQLGYGLARMPGGESAPGITVAIVQPVSPLRVSNSDVATQEEIAARLLALSVPPPDASTPDVIVWPEGAASFSPTTPAFNAPYHRAMRQAQEATSATLVAHGVDFERSPQGRLQYRSAIFGVEPDGAIGGVYHKQILMPFGEYLPMESTFPILRRWLPDARSIVSGGEFRPLAMAGASVAPVICYEVLFPAPVAELCRAGAGIILVLTNDRWYGLRQQPPQHLAFAILRAIENRRPVIRGAHSGISAFIEADGRIGPYRSTPVEEIATLTGIVAPGAASSVYTRTGDALVRYLLTPAVLAMLAWGLFRRKPEAPTPRKAGKRHHAG